jgi:hypothetical protein
MFLAIFNNTCRVAVVYIIKKLLLYCLRHSLFKHFNVFVCLCFYACIFLYMIIIIINGLDESKLMEYYTISRHVKPNRNAFSCTYLNNYYNQKS